MRSSKPAARRRGTLLAGACCSSNGCLQAPYHNHGARLAWLGTAEAEEGPKPLQTTECWRTPTGKEALRRSMRNSQRLERWRPKRDWLAPYPGGWSGDGKPRPEDCRRVWLRPREGKPALRTPQSRRDSAQRGRRYKTKGRPAGSPATPEEECATESGKGSPTRALCIQGHHRPVGPADQGGSRRVSRARAPSLGHRRPRQ